MMLQVKINEFCIKDFWMPMRLIYFFKKKYIFLDGLGPNRPQQIPDSLVQTVQNTD